jgi:hypothetical protein
MNVINKACVVGIFLQQKHGNFVLHQVQEWHKLSSIRYYLQKQVLFIEFLGVHLSIFSKM